MSIRKHINNYLKKKRCSYPDIFHIRNWRIASLEEKKIALQKLENHYAKVQGRDPRKVEFVKLPPNTHGNFDGDKITINENIVDHKLSNVECVDTIIHEGRHVYQHECVNNVVKHNEPVELQKWKENYVMYFPTFSGHRYYFQPIERDAFTYAHKETMRFMEPLQKEYGKDPLLETYQMNILRQHDFYEKKALMLDGPGYIEVIDGQIREGYEVETKWNELYGEDGRDDQQKTLPAMRIPSDKRTAGMERKQPRSKEEHSR